MKNKVEESIRRF